MCLYASPIISGTPPRLVGVFCSCQIYSYSMQWSSYPIDSSDFSQTPLWRGCPKDFDSAGVCTSRVGASPKVVGQPQLSQRTHLTPFFLVALPLCQWWPQQCTLLLGWSLAKRVKCPSCREENECPGAPEAPPEVASVLPCPPLVAQKIASAEAVQSWNVMAFGTPCTGESTRP